MKKSELKNGMIVETTGGNFGIVVFKDSTDKNCVKFLYNPNWLSDHGCLISVNFIMSLDDFDDDLNAWHSATKDEVDTFNDIKIGDKIVDWQIIRVMQPCLIWERKNLKPTCGGLMGNDYE